MLLESLGAMMTPALPVFVAILTAEATRQAKLGNKSFGKAGEFVGK
jgi:hypothetical protein